MPSIPHLLAPKWRSFLRPTKGSTGHSKFTLLFFALLGILFWWGIYSGSIWLCQKCLLIEDIGELLLQKVLSMALLTFFSILVFSNLVTAFTTFFLSDDLQLLVSTPISNTTFFLSRSLETLLHASWMILIFGFPFILAYGQTFNAPPLFYLQLALVVIPFVIIPASLAILLALLLATAFPAQKTRDLILFLFVVAFAGLYLYFRILQPERFLAPEQFSTAIDFLGMLRSPTSSFLPSDWFVSSIFPYLSKKSGPPQPIYLATLYLTAASLSTLSFWFHEAFYNEAFSRAQAGRKLRVQGNRFWNTVINTLTSPFPPLTRSMLGKEFKTFVRNPGQWAQLLLLGALVIVYIFNFSSLRQLSSLKLHGVPALFATLGIYLFNLLLLGFVISAVAVRFAFPAVSLEGKCFWLIQQSPISMRQFLRAKFWSVFLPLLFLSEFMTIATNFFIQSDALHSLLAIVSVAMMTFGITGLGVGLGAIYPRFEIENPAKIATGFGGVIYMISCIVWILLLIALELVPLRHILWSKATNAPIPLRHFVHMGLCAFFAILLTTLLYNIPMRRGARSLENRK